MTCSTSATSIPRATISVATRRRTFPERKDSNADFLSACVRPPCIHSAGCPDWVRRLATCSTRPCVFAKIKILPVRNTTWSTTKRGFSTSVVSMFSSFIFGASEATPTTLTRTGSFRYLFTSFTISVGIVAENRNVCLSGGRLFTICSTCGANPMSSILSTSSSTSMLMFSIGIPRPI